MIGDLTAIAERLGASADLGAELLGPMQQQLIFALASVAGRRQIRAWPSSRNWPSSSRGVQAASGAICRSRLLTATTNLSQQGWSVWDFLEQPGSPIKAAG